MFIEAFIVEALRLLEEAEQGGPISLRGYPLNYHKALGDPTGLMVLCYVLSERLLHFTLLEGGNSKCARIQR